jgi:hypothetical protein
LLRSAAKAPVRGAIPLPILLSRGLWDISDLVSLYLSGVFFSYH